MDEQPVETTGETTNGEPKFPFKRIILIVAVLCFARWVWPTPWKQDIQLKGYTKAKSNRFTGETWVHVNGQWFPYEPLERLLSIGEELQYLDKYNYRSDHAKLGRIKLREMDRVNKIKDEARSRILRQKREKLTVDEALALAAQRALQIRSYQILRDEFPRQWDRVISPSVLEGVNRVDKEYGGDLDRYHKRWKTTLLLGTLESGEFKKDFGSDRDLLLDAAEAGLLE